jgi:ABC-type antimicrobial peptide transport system permease subunit
VTVIQGTMGTRASAAFVSANYFSLLGVSAGLGRVFHDERDRDLVVISDRFWKERFEGRRSVVGESLRIGNATLSVGGIVPRRFLGLQPDLSIDVWVPLSTLEARLNAIDDRYFRTLGVRVLAGRAFDPVEAWRPGGVVILNAALARRLFGSEHAAIGRSVTSVDGRTRTDRTVVGVVDNTADVDLRNRSAPAAYVPVGDSPLLLIHVRTASDVTSLIPVIRRTLTSLEASVPILGIETIRARHRRALERERLLAGLSAAVGWLALVVSAVGIFGRVSHDVSTRIREVGIRSALGATRTHIAARFLRGTAGIVIAGLAFGVTASLGASRVLEGFLYGVDATNSGTYIGSACLVVVVAGIATLLPLARAFGAGTAANLIHGRWS